MNFTAKTNTREQAQVNTRGLSFFNNESALESSTMQLGYWNEMVSLRINPALPEDKQTETNKFDYDVNISTALTLDKAITLKKAVDEDILPAFNEKREVSKGVPVGGNSVISVGVKVVDDKPEAFLAIYKSLDGDTKKPGDMLVYNFRTVYTVDDYNPETGEYTLTQGVPGELNVFTRALGAAVEALTNAVAHSMRNVNRYANEQQKTMLTEIATKVGVEVRQPYSNNRGNFGNNRRDVFGGGGSNSQSNTNSSSASELDAPTSKMANIDAMDEFMK